MHEYFSSNFGCDMFDLEDEPEYVPEPPFSSVTAVKKFYRQGGTLSMYVAQMAQYHAAVRVNMKPNLAAKVYGKVEGSFFLVGERDAEEGLVLDNGEMVLPVTAEEAKVAVVDGTLAFVEGDHPQKLELERKIEDGMKESGIREVEEGEPDFSGKASRILEYGDGYCYLYAIREECMDAAAAELGAYPSFLDVLMLEERLFEDDEVLRFLPVRISGLVAHVDPGSFVGQCGVFDFATLCRVFIVANDMTRGAKVSAVAGVVFSGNASPFVEPGWSTAEHSGSEEAVDRLRVGGEGAGVAFDLTGCWFAVRRGGRYVAGVTGDNTLTVWRKLEEGTDIRSRDRLDYLGAEVRDGHIYVRFHLDGRYAEHVLCRANLVDTGQVYEFRVQYHEVEFAV